MEITAGFTANSNNQKEVPLRMNINTVQSAKLSKESKTTVLVHSLPKSGGGKETTIKSKAQFPFRAQHRADVHFAQMMDPLCDFNKSRVWPYASIIPQSPIQTPLPSFSSNPSVQSTLTSPSQAVSNKPLIQFSCAVLIFDILL